MVDTLVQDHQLSVCDVHSNFVVKLLMTKR